MEDVSLVLEKLAPAQDDEVKTFADAFLTQVTRFYVNPERNRASGGLPLASL